MLSQRLVETQSRDLAEFSQTFSTRQYNYSELDQLLYVKNRSLVIHFSEDFELRLL